jgi:hypothetical protein
MRTREGDLQEERLRPVVTTQELDRGVAGPARGMEFLGQRVGLGLIVVPADAGGVGIQI